MKFLRTPFLQNISGRLLLNLSSDENFIRVVITTAKLHSTESNLRLLLLLLYIILLLLLLLLLLLYLRLTLVFVLNSALREKINFYFQEFFARLNKIFVLAGGLRTGVSFYGA